MKTKAPDFEFDPSLRIFGAGDHLCVVFDSQSPNDALRATQTVCIPRAFEHLGLVVQGFDAAQDDGHRRDVQGSVSLRVRQAGDVLLTHEVAKMRLVFHSEADRKGALTHIDPLLVAYTVQQALSERLNDALIEHYQREASSALSGQSQAFAAEVFSSSHFASPPPSPSRRALREQAASDAARRERSRRRKTLLAWVVPPVLVVAVLATLSHLASTQSPVENAVAQQMSNDPESIKAQVELTKQTLQSMGLDPGQGGDLGCLAPQ